MALFRMVRFPEQCCGLLGQAPAYGSETGAGKSAHPGNMFSPLLFTHAN